MDNTTTVLSYYPIGDNFLTLRVWDTRLKIVETTTRACDKQITKYTISITLLILKGTSKGKKQVTWQLTIVPHLVGSARIQVHFK